MSKKRKEPYIILHCGNLYTKIDCIREVIKTKLPKEYFNNYLCDILERSRYTADLIDILDIDDRITTNPILKQSEGSYGKVYIYHDEVIKIPKIDLSLGDSKKIQGEFIEENIINIILNCFHDNLVQFTNENFPTLFPNPLPNPFPKIKLLSKHGPDANDKFEIFAVMEKLDTCNFFDTSEEYISEEYSEEYISKKYIKQIIFILILAFFLYFLQTSCKFTHGDLHKGNVMIRIFDNPIKLKIPYKDTYFEIETFFIPCIIDLGMVCADLTECCALKELFVSNSMYEETYKVSNIKKLGMLQGDEREEEVEEEVKRYTHCKNKSQDLRLFFASLIEYDLAPGLRTYLTKIFNNDIYKNKKLNVRNKKYSTYFHNFYHEVSKIDDPNFYPENVILEMIKMLV